ncbi:MAG: hypothetical protein QOH23_1038 [Gaiellaceae bacterium]|jgi:hypothetical protein|nr:hypothetical protein [Gaiellaceae bacterium]
MTGTDEHVTAYLKELDQALAGLPRSRRREVLDEVAARGDFAGDPAQIAAAARSRFGVGPDPGSWREVATLFLIPVGGVAVPVVGWLVGVVLLWQSDAWTRRDKLIGTLVVPGGLLTPFVLLTVVSGALGVAALVVLFVAPLVSTYYLARQMRKEKSRPGRRLFKGNWGGGSM